MTSAICVQFFMLYSSVHNTHLVSDTKESWARHMHGFWTKWFFYRLRMFAWVVIYQGFHLSPGRPRLVCHMAYALYVSTHRWLGISVGTADLSGTVGVGWRIITQCFSKAKLIVGQHCLGMVMLMFMLLFLSLAIALLLWCYLFY